MVKSLSICYYANIKGPVIKVGTDRFLTLAGPNGLKKNAELLADLNQHALDADNGYNTEILKNYDSVMDAILFGEGAHAEGRGLFKAIKFKKNEPVDLTGGSATILPSERQLVRNLVHPYRDLMSLANKVYDKGNAKKVSFQKLIVRNLKKILFFLAQLELHSIVSKILKIEGIILIK